MVHSVIIIYDFSSVQTSSGPASVSRGYAGSSVNRVQFLREAFSVSCAYRLCMGVVHMGVVCAI